VRFAVTSPHRDGFAVEVVDAAGRRVRELRVDAAGAATVEVSWDLTDARGRRVAPGLYLVVARPEGSEGVSRKVLVVR
jgi:hypothetical protein